MRDLGAVVLPLGTRAGGRGFDAERLLAPEQAILAFFARVALAPPGIERVPLEQADGRVLAADAVCREDQPTHARSTMDGFALASGGASRRTIAGEIAMGHAPPRALGPDEAFRIPTGGALPEGADAVVPLEDVDERDGEIVLRGPVSPGDCFTPRGADLRAGERALAAGRLLGAPELGVLATLGLTLLEVYKRPRFGIFSTGDELVDVRTTPHAGQVRDSNRYALAAALRAMGAEPVQLPRLADEPHLMKAALAAALEECDGIVLSGGSSVGERDYTPRVVDELGSPGAVVHGLRVKPGKPTLLAAVGTKPILGLPGNPTSSLTILEAIARPIVLACTGRCDARPIVLDATLGSDLAGRAGWTWYVPVRILAGATRLIAEPLALRSSHVSLPARAAGYVTLGEDRPHVAAGERVRVSLYSSGGAPFELDAKPGGP
jgi:molybdenum cofactor synthesis domain-containing protein